MEKIERLNLTKEENNFLKDAVQYYANMLLTTLKEERAIGSNLKPILKVVETCLDVKDKLSNPVIIKRKDFEEGTEKFMTPEEEVAEFYKIY